MPFHAENLSRVSSSYNKTSSTLFTYSSPDNTLETIELDPAFFNDAQGLLKENDFIMIIDPNGSSADFIITSSVPPIGVKGSFRNEIPFSFVQEGFNSLYGELYRFNFEFGTVPNNSLVTRSLFPSSIIDYSKPFYVTGYIYDSGFLKIAAPLPYIEGANQIRLFLEGAGGTLTVNIDTNFDATNFQADISAYFYLL